MCHRDRLSSRNLQQWLAPASSLPVARTSEFQRHLEGGVRAATLLRVSLGDVGQGGDHVAKLYPHQATLAR
jgi:hypothetical protein